MKYLSTRGQSPAVSAGQALLHGAAPDGGLYLPERLPDLSALLISSGSYAELAGQVFAELLPDFDRQALHMAAEQAYTDRFERPEICPLVRVGDVHVLELFHGPTAAFKDLALSALPRLMALARQALTPGTRYLVLAATSGDTGSAAMRGFQGVEGFYTLVYYPARGVSRVQRAQMRALSQGNARARAINGDFDAAQAAVKAAFSRADSLLPQGMALSSANSINIGRLVPQVVYYFTACRELLARGEARPGQPVDFIVPTGNFGNILAGFLARRMGAPIGQLVCASNGNRVLYDFLRTGCYDRRRPLKKTLSPSMDILVSSNLERLLYDASGGDADRVRDLMDQLSREGWYQADAGIHRLIADGFTGCWASDSQTRAAIRAAWEEHRYLMDPHTAAAWHALGRLERGHKPCVVLSTASPFKFPETVLDALGHPMPPGQDPLEALSDLSGQGVPQALSGLQGFDPETEAAIEKDSVMDDILREAAAWFS